MTIIIAHKPINRSDTIGVMWNHIICTAAVPYNKKVTIFPCQSAPCTFPVFRITRHPLTTIYSSLPAIITIKRSICGKRVNRQINIAACVSLSATGSSIFPKLLIQSKSVFFCLFSLFYSAGISLWRRPLRRILLSRVSCTVPFSPALPPAPESPAEDQNFLPQRSDFLSTYPAHSSGARSR